MIKCRTIWWRSFSNIIISIFWCIISYDTKLHFVLIMGWYLSDIWLKTFAFQQFCLISSSISWRVEKYLYNILFYIPLILSIFLCCVAHHSMLNGYLQFYTTSMLLPLRWIFYLKPNWIRVKVCDTHGDYLQYCLYEHKNVLYWSSFVYLIRMLPTWIVLNVISRVTKVKCC